MFPKGGDEVALNLNSQNDAQHLSINNRLEDPLFKQVLGDSAVLAQDLSRKDNESEEKVQVPFETLVKSKPTMFFLSDSPMNQEQNQIEEGMQNFAFGEEDIDPDVSFELQPERPILLPIVSSYLSEQPSTGLGEVDSEPNLVTPTPGFGSQSPLANSSRRAKICTSSSSPDSISDAIVVVLDSAVRKRLNKASSNSKGIAPIRRGM